MKIYPLKISKKTIISAVLILIVGFALRLSFSRDIEFKADEAYSFSYSQEVLRTKPWPWVGMNSSAGMVNPGLSVWIFVGLARLFSADTPIELSRAVQILNCLALLILVLYAVKRADADERRLWIWSAAFAAVNPLSIVLQRKIWAQSTLPFFSILFLICWKNRASFWCAFLWGLIGASLGQIHMGGFFFSAAVLIWTYLFGRSTRASWKGWWAGSIIGALPLIPWIITVAQSGSEHSSIVGLMRILNLAYWKYWIISAWGINISYSLGDHFWEFLSYPYIGSYPTYIFGAAQVALYFILFGLFISWVYRFKSSEGKWRSFFLGDHSSTDLLIQAAFVGMGVLLTVAAIPLYQHYYLVTFPLQFLWLARLGLKSGLRGQWALWMVLICQFTISLGFLNYIHHNGGAPKGDFGISYSRQLEMRR
ncbi:MAG: hypothetical protein KGQ59_07415 [Bdellovibrionales bacterium]|nr:hypothetical protein [Bdellovibrionales bacterium]